MVIAAGEGIAERAIALGRRIAPRGGAAESLSDCIKSFGATRWPGVVWRFSRLSVDGSPLQFDFSTADDSLRFATEVSGPEFAAGARLRAAAALIERLGVAAVPAERLRAWESLQSGRELRWGAWLGVRHDGSTVRAKLYVEVPLELRTDRRIARPIVPSSRLMMIGYDCSGNAEEHYFRQPQMDADELAAFVSAAGGATQRRPLIDAFAELCALPPRAALHWMNFGYSVTPRPGSGADYCMFVRAASLGSNTRIREHFLCLEERGGRRSSAYRDLVGALAQERLPDHEIVSLVAGDRRELEMRVGISAAALARL
jgi:hypothetical protein